MADKQYYVYSLNLECGKKYVGITSNPEKRIYDHLAGKDYVN
jgi:predicted GIY-YIG superfamily endonuclease